MNFQNLNYKNYRILILLFILGFSFVLVEDGLRLLNVKRVEAAVLCGGHDCGSLKCCDGYDCVNGQWQASGKYCDVACEPAPSGSCCIPNCVGKSCGNDGCGGSCGSCGSGYHCSGGSCVCSPNCTNRACGPDGCGGSCGSCGYCEKCETGQCVDYVYTCSGSPGPCQECDICTGHYVSQCTGNQVCYNNSCCTPDCSCAANTCIGSKCDNGCGGTCSGTKDCSTPCTPNCSCAANTCIGSQCDDGCGGKCDGTKTPNCSCAANTCIGSKCDDGCGGKCNGTKDCSGPCTPNCSCAVNTCIGSKCDDGCGGTCSGTKDCSTPCTPNCSCAANTCKGSQCDDGCGGKCDGTKTCDNKPSSTGCGGSNTNTGCCPIGSGGNKGVTGNCTNGECTFLENNGDCPSTKTCTKNTCSSINEGQQISKCQSSTFNWNTNQPCPDNKNQCNPADDNACNGIPSCMVYYCYGTDCAGKEHFLLKADDPCPKGTCSKGDSNACQGTSKPCNIGICQFRDVVDNNTGQIRKVGVCQKTTTYVKPDQKCPDSGCSSDTECPGGGDDGGDNNPPQNDKYNCNQTTGDCYVSTSGSYSDINTCEQNCNFNCDTSNWKCLFSANGVFSNKTQCETNCKSGAFSLSLTSNKTEVLPNEPVLFTAKPFSGELPYKQYEWFIEDPEVSQGQCKYITDTDSSKIPRLKKCKPMDGLIDSKTINNIFTLLFKPFLNNQNQAFAQIQLPKTKGTTTTTIRTKGTTTTTNTIRTKGTTTTTKTISTNYKSLEYQWSVPGTYEVFAKLTDNKGNIAQSNKIQIIVRGSTPTTEPPTTTSTTVLPIPVCSVTLEAVPKTIFLGRTLNLEWSPIGAKECQAYTSLLKENGQKITGEEIKIQGGGWYGKLLSKEDNEQLYNNTDINTTPKPSLNSPHTSTLKPTAKGNYIYTISCDCGAEAETEITTEEEVEVKVIPVPYWREIIPVLPGFLRGLFNR